MFTHTHTQAHTHSRSATPKHFWLWWAEKESQSESERKRKRERNLYFAPSKALSLLIDWSMKRMMKRVYVADFCFVYAEHTQICRLKFAHHIRVNVRVFFSFFFPNSSFYQFVYSLCVQLRWLDIDFFCFDCECTCGPWCGLCIFACCWCAFSYSNKFAH